MASNSLLFCSSFPCESGNPFCLWCLAVGYENQNGSSLRRDDGSCRPLKDSSTTLAVERRASAHHRRLPPRPARAGRLGAKRRALAMSRRCSPQLRAPSSPTSTAAADAEKPATPPFRVPQLLPVAAAARIASPPIPPRRCARLKAAWLPPWCWTWTRRCNWSKCRPTRRSGCATTRCWSCCIRPDCASPNCARCAGTTSTSRRRPGHRARQGFETAHGAGGSHARAALRGVARGTGRSRTRWCSRPWQGTRSPRAQCGCTPNRAAAGPVQARAPAPAAPHLRQPRAESLRRPARVQELLGHADLGTTQIYTHPISSTSPACTTARTREAQGLRLSLSSRSGRRPDRT